MNLKLIYRVKGISIKYKDLQFMSTKYQDI